MQPKPQIESSRETESAPLSDRPSEFWAGKAVAAFVLAEDLKIRKMLRDALKALLEAVKAEPAMRGRQYVQLGIQVTNALRDSEIRNLAWECAARKQSLPEPADCNWPVCGCDPSANRVIEALEESAAHTRPSESGEKKCSEDDATRIDGSEPDVSANAKLGI